MKPEELVLTIIDMHTRHAPMATIITVAARALAAERERCAEIADARAEEAGRIFDEAREAAQDIAAALRALN